MPNNKAMMRIWQELVDAVGSTKSTHYTPKTTLRDYLSKPGKEKEIERIKNLRNKRLELEEINNRLKQPYTEEDELARIQRQRDMGFDTETFHGTSGERIFNQDWKKRFSGEGPSGDEVIKSFKPSSEGTFNGRGIYTSPLPYKYEPYASGKAPQVYPLVVRGKKIFSVDDHLPREIDVRQPITNFLSSEDSFNTLSKVTGKSIQELRKIANDGNKLENLIRQYPEHFEGMKMGSEVKTFDPKNIRSKFAKFDPSRANSDDILAGAGGAVTAGGLGYGIKKAITPENAIASEPEEKDYSKFPLMSELLKKKSEDEEDDE